MRRRQALLGLFWNAKGIEQNATGKPQHDYGNPTKCERDWVSIAKCLIKKNTMDPYMGPRRTQQIIK
jgi:hypothetical protein